MPYPDHLIPSNDHKLIEDNLVGFSLVRHTETRDILNEVGKIKVKCVCHPTANCENLSVSLFGIFNAQDILYTIKGGRKGYFFQEWVVGEEVDPPTEEEYSIDKNKGCFYISIDDLRSLKPIKYTIGESSKQYELSCQIVHCPTRCNFWHFEIRWINEEGFLHDMSGSWKRRVAKLIKDRVSESGKKGFPPSCNIPNRIYRR